MSTLKKDDQRYRLGLLSHTLKHWSRVTGIPLKVLNNRMSNEGMPFRVAITTPYKDNKLTYEYNGESRTLLDWSKQLNISYQTLFYRVILYKTPVDKAFTTPVKPVKKYFYKGKWLSIPRIAKLSGVSAYRLRDRLVNKGMTLNVALESAKSRYRSKNT